MSNYKDNNGGRRRWRKRMRTHGFRARMRTPGGRAVLRRRRAKGRQLLAVSLENHSFSRR